MDEQEKEQVRTVAKLARRCLNVKGEDRPLMKELAAELEGLRGFRRGPFVQSNNDVSSSLETRDADLYVILPSTTYSSDSGSGQHSVDTEMMRSLDIPS
ncbi:hypothetical protein ACHQM5_012546 [Ranunculus cassubicifolius]